MTPQHPLRTKSTVKKRWKSTTHNSGTFDSFFFPLSIIGEIYWKRHVYGIIFSWRRDIQCKYSGNRFVHMVFPGFRFWDFICYWFYDSQSTCSFWGPVWCRITWRGQNLFTTKHSGTVPVTKSYSNSLVVCCGKQCGADTCPFSHFMYMMKILTGHQINAAHSCIITTDHSAYMWCTVRYPSTRGCFCAMDALTSLSLSEAVNYSYGIEIEVSQVL